MVSDINNYTPNILLSCINFLLTIYTRISSFVVCIVYTQNRFCWILFITKLYSIESLWPKYSCIAIQNWVHIFYIPMGIYLYFIIMSCCQHGYPWPSLATSPYHSSPPAGLQGYILCPHIVAVFKFELVVLLLHGHMWGSIGVHHLWAHPLLLQQCPACLEKQGHVYIDMWKKRFILPIFEIGREKLRVRNSLR